MVVRVLVVVVTAASLAGHPWWILAALLQNVLYVKVVVVQRVDQILRGEIAVGQIVKKFETQIIRVGHHRVDRLADRTGASNGCRAADHAYAHTDTNTDAYTARLVCTIIVAGPVAAGSSALALHLQLQLLLLLVCCCRAGALHKLLLLHGKLLLLLGLAHVNAGHLHLGGHHAAAAAGSCVLLLLQQLLHLHIAAAAAATAGSHVLLLLLSHQLLLHLRGRQLHLRSIGAGHHATTTAAIRSVARRIGRSIGHEVTWKTTRLVAKIKL